MAICDTDLQFTFVDVRQPGRCSDSGVLEASTFGHAFVSGKLFDLRAFVKWVDDSAVSLPCLSVKWSHQDIHLLRNEVFSHNAIYALCF